MQAGVTWVHSYVSPDHRKTFCIYDGPKQIAALYEHYRKAFDEWHALELQTNYTLSSSRKFLPQILAEYQASGKRWIPTTAIYATRNRTCDY